MPSHLLEPPEGKGGPGVQAVQEEAVKVKITVSYKGKPDPKVEVGIVRTLKKDAWKSTGTGFDLINRRRDMFFEKDN